MFESVFPAADNNGVDTSSTSQSAKYCRISAYRRARKCKAARVESAFMLTQKFEQLCLVPNVDAELVGLVELRARLAAGDDEAGLLRHATGHFSAECFEL